MNKASLAVVVVGLIALTACGRNNQDQLTNSDVNAVAQDNLDELSNQAANVAAESQALEQQSADLNAQAQTTDNAAGAQTPADENIVGM